MNNMSLWSPDFLTNLMRESMQDYEAAAEEARQAAIARQSLEELSPVKRRSFAKLLTHADHIHARALGVSLA